MYRVKISIDVRNSVDFFSTGRGLFRRGVDFVEAGVYAGEYPQKLTSDILWETSVILGVKSDQTQKSVKK